MIGKKMNESSFVFSVAFCLLLLYEGKAETSSNLGCFPLLPPGVHGGTTGGGAHVNASIRVRVQEAFQKTLVAGASVYQLGLTWSTIEPTAGSLNVSTLSSLLDELSSVGVQAFLNLAAINTDVLSVPSDLLDPASNGTRLVAGMNFSSPAVVSRYLSMVDAVAGTLTKHRVFFLGVGNEVAGPLQAVPAYAASWASFVAVVCDHVHMKIPNVSCGFSSQFSSLESLHSVPWWQAAIAAADAVPITYYPLGSNFVVEDPSVVPGDVATMLKLLPSDQCLLLQEAGYPSGYIGANASKDVIHSSEAMQKQFLLNVFQAITTSESGRIRALGVFKLADWTIEQCENFENYYHIHQAGFLEYLCTLGLLDGEGFPKEAFPALLAGLANLTGTKQLM